MTNNFKVLSDLEHIRHRFAMYGGSRDLQKEEVFLQGKFQKVAVVSGLLKVINEIIDNSVDEFIRTKGEHATMISVNARDGKITVKDNGRGIPNVKHDDKYQLQIAFTQARAGSNFDDDNREGAGMNGVGSAITFATSTTFNAKSTNNGLCVSMTSRNADNVKVTEKPDDGPTGTEVTFKPNYEFFGLEDMDENHLKMIEERIKGLAVSFPDITFKFNGRVVRTRAKDYFPETKSYKTEKAEFFIGKSEGNFETFSLINGLQVKSGSHIDFFTYQVISELREIIKKRKKQDIPPAKLKNHIRVFAVMTGFKALKFDSQTKERVTNSTAEVKEAIGDFDPAKFAQTLFKDKELIDDILAFLKFQEDRAAKKDLEKLNKVKKIKSDKYFPAVGTTERIFVVEGDSASGGLIKCLGRKGNAFYALKGVPLNVLEVSHQKFAANKELSELFTIISRFPNAEICIATDADADGSRIRGLVALFMFKYFPDHPTKGKLKILRTPVAVAKKSGTPVEWAYGLNDVSKLNQKLTINYVKGLGSWSVPDLRAIIEADGMEAMLPPVEFDNDELFTQWFSGATSDFRKDQLRNAPPFNIMKV